MQGPLRGIFTAREQRPRSRISRKRLVINNSSVVRNSNTRYPPLGTYKITILSLRYSTTVKYMFYSVFRCASRRPPRAQASPYRAAFGRLKSRARYVSLCVLLGDDPWRDRLSRSPSSAAIQWQPTPIQWHAGRAANKQLNFAVYRARALATRCLRSYRAYRSIIACLMYPFWLTKAFQPSCKSVQGNGEFLAPLSGTLYRVNAALLRA